MHPLQQDLSSLSYSEIEEKIKELSKKYFMVLNLSPGAANQVLMILEDYKLEKETRDLQKSSNKDSISENFDGLIDIG
jgi:hypothetical protein